MKATHEIRVPENNACECHGQDCTWDPATRMWYHPTDGSPVPRECWPEMLHELSGWPTDEPPGEGYPVTLCDGDTVKGYFYDGDEVFTPYEEWFVGTDQAVAFTANEIPDGWLHPLGEGSK